MTDIRTAFHESPWVNSRECVDCGCSDDSHSRYRRRCDECQTAHDDRLAANDPRTR